MKPDIRFKRNGKKVAVIAELPEGMGFVVSDILVTSKTSETYQVANEKYFVDTLFHSQVFEATFRHNVSEEILSLLKEKQFLLHDIDQIKQDVAILKQYYHKFRNLFSFNQSHEDKVKNALDELNREEERIIKKYEG